MVIPETVGRLVVRVRDLVSQTEDGPYPTVACSSSFNELNQEVNARLIKLGMQGGICADPTLTYTKGIS